MVVDITERIGQQNYNKNNYLMTVIQYNSADNIVVQFNDSNNTTTTTTWYRFKHGTVKNPNHIKNQRLNSLSVNRFGSIMKCVEYDDANHIVVEFQDQYKTRVHTAWSCFINQSVRNPYDKSFYGVGMIGNKYPSTVNGKPTKEFMCWQHILERGFSDTCKSKNSTYKDVTVCNEWLLFENFYEWLHNQENFDKWILSNTWAIDKDILVKGNKIYSPETCCLVPQEINNLFCKHDISRGEYPIGVIYDSRRQQYSARLSEKYINTNHQVLHIGYYPTPEDAFYLGYKPYKENYIKQVAQEEFDKSNITKRCYDAMMIYQVEITD